MTLANTAGSVESALIESLKPWSTKNNIKIDFVEGTSSTNFAKVQAGTQAHNQTIDLIGLNDVPIAQGVGQGQWAKIDRCVVTNASLLDQALAFPKDVVGDGPYAVRVNITLTGLAYNTQVFQKNGWSPPTSWLDIFDPKYAKCLALLSPSQGVPYIPMLNYLTAKGDFSDDTQTMAKFKTIGPSVLANASTLTQSLQLLQSGAACLTPSLISRVVDLQNQGAPLAFVNPKEGVVFIGGNYAIPKDAPDLIAAQQAMNELLSAASAQTLFEKAFLTSTNLKVSKPSTGLAAKLPTAADFKSLGVKDIPLSAYAKQDQWTRDLAAVTSK